MKQDTLQAVADSITTTAQNTDGINFWMIIAIAEFMVLLLLLLSKSQRDTKRADVKRKVMAEGNVDFANIMNSSFNAETLYKSLLVACHPDRFEPDVKKVAIANDLATRITKNKHDIKALNALREEAKTKLNINF